MKKFLFFLSLIVLVSCGDKNPVNQSIISGTVLNNPADFIIMQSQSGTRDTLFINEDGTFSFVKQLDKPGNYYLQANKKMANIYLEPGRNLEINFDASDLDATLKFAGDLSLENLYNREIDQFSRESGRIGRDTYMSEPAAFHDAIIKQRESKEAFLNEFISKNPGLSENFINSQRLSYEFSYYSFLLNYESAHTYYAKVEEVELPGDWYSFIDNVDINNPEYLDNNLCVSVVSSIIDRGILETTGLGEDEWGTAQLLEAQFKWINENISDTSVSDYFLNSYITSIIDSEGPGAIEEYVNQYINNTSNEENRKILSDKVAEWAPLAPGADAPAFTLPDINGNEVSLSDFKGKYVYIDFWATWCGPCKIEIPVLEELAAEYAGKNIVIVSISVDKDKQAWIDMVTRDKPEWLQLHDGINMNDDYLVKYIPSFVLLDRDGKILDPRAPRPSSGEILTNLFNSLEGI